MDLGVGAQGHDIEGVAAPLGVAEPQVQDPRADGRLQIRPSPLGDHPAVLDALERLRDPAPPP